MKRFIIYKMLDPILRIYLKVLYRPTIIGKENIPMEGPIIVAANHKHLMDQCGPILSTKRILHYLLSVISHI